MNDGRYILSQILDFISSKKFSKHVRRYNGNYRTKNFPCWSQLLSMLLAQYTHRKSLSDTTLCLKTSSDKLYHLGIKSTINKSTISRANENRDYRIFQDFAMELIAEAKELYTDYNQLDLDLKGSIFAIDSSHIDICLSLAPWAVYRAKRGGIKLHLQLDLKTTIPEFIYISDGKTHDVNFFEMVDFLPKSYYIFDRGYLSFEKLYKINLVKAFFITREKTNMKFDFVKELKSKENIYDSEINLRGFYTKQNYPEKLRRIKYFDETAKKELVFLTNNFRLKSENVAKLYKYRWEIETFFKWIKQNLEIQTFWGRSENAVKVQIWTAIIAYVIILIAKKRLKLSRTPYEIMQILSYSIFQKEPLYQLLEEQSILEKTTKNPNQLTLNLF